MGTLELKEKVKKLRSEGKTYSEIQNQLGITLPKSTISTWSRGVKLPKSYESKIKRLSKFNLENARKLALVVKRENRDVLLEQLDTINHDLPELLKKKHIGKIALALLYLAKGSKSTKGSLMFGNSDPMVIRLFMKLLRKCFIVDESKLRCTVQGRADQNFDEIEKFWSKASGISLKQFYKSRIDPRSIGKISKKPNYKGVCRIDYFSARTDLELKRIVYLFDKNYLGPIV